MTDVIVVIGAGQIGQAIARRVGVGKRIVLADMRPDNANAAAQVLGNAGYDLRPSMRRRATLSMDSSRDHEPGRRHRADPCCRRLAYAGVTGDDPQSRSKLSQTNWNVLSFVSLISIWADLRQCGFCCWSHSEDEPKGSKAQRLLSRFSAASAKRMARANAKDTPIQLLFHYTNEEALYSIIKSESFWFTSIYFMDDDAELSFGFG